MTVVIYAIESYMLVKRYEIVFEQGVDAVTSSTINSILKAAKKSSNLRGRAFVLKVNNEFFFASRLPGGGYKVFTLDFNDLQ